MQIIGPSILGGVLIGAAATVLLACNGRIAGVSGIVNGLQSGSWSDRSWRIMFLLGLMGGADIMFLFMPSSLSQRVSFPALAVIVAGLLVGFGTRMGNGCTSGHGVCGLGRLSLRSLVAVLVFMVSAMTTVTVTRHVWNLLP
jgi:uncharacterized membrane protein YedE/YeeE